MPPSNVYDKGKNAVFLKCRVSEVFLFTIFHFYDGAQSYFNSNFSRLYIYTVYHNI